MPSPRFQPGQDPRKVLSNHAERGTSRFTYDRRAVAKARGVSLVMLRKDVQAGKVDLSDLASVARYCCRVAELEELLREVQKQIDSNNAATWGLVDVVKKLQATIK